MNRSIRPALAGSFALAALTLSAPCVQSAYVWVEGEKPAKADVKRHPWWYDQVKKDQLSGGDFISNWSDKPGLLEYNVTAPHAGDYELWVHANPVGTKLEYQIDGGDWASVDMSKAQDSTNIAGDGKLDVRFIAWIRVGEVKLKDGANTVGFKMDSENNNHGLLDCFVLSDKPFQPHGVLKPEGIASVQAADAAGANDWFAFNPGPDPLKGDCPIDLRHLNEKQAGDGGFIKVKNGEFVHSNTGKPVRFWAVNGPPDPQDPKSLRDTARVLAKYGVNMVRIHAPYLDENGNIDPAKVQHGIEIVEAMASEGIYVDFSTYWYGFYTPKPNTPFLPGYNGHQAPVAVLFFYPDFQKQYRSWWTALLTTPSKTTGKRLIDNPAVASLEMMNEDSLFFWTFSEGAIPDPEMRVVEKDFGDWLIKKYGTLDAALKAWNGLKVPRDNFAEGRVGFRPMWNFFSERTPRDKDAAAFLTELQHGFYQNTYQFLRQLGFKGSITGSNWTTASPEYLGPLDKYTYTACDYIDRHGYFGGLRQGANEGWAVMDGQTCSDRSALRFDPQKPGEARQFVNPVIDPHYDGKPSVISEVSFERPNRYRAEAPLYFACYGALQDSGGFMHFAYDTSRWSVKPGYFMQPWTLMTPSQAAQYPAAAMIFRQGLVAPGDEVVQLNLKIADIEALKGTPMPQDASFDELRAKDVPAGVTLKPGNVIDPLVHYVGRTNVNFTATGGPAKLLDTKGLIDRQHQTVTSTNHQLRLDYGKGFLLIDAPQAQGASGNLHDAGAAELKDLTVTSDLPSGHIVAVSLDGKPLATSGKILLQVMSEEKTSEFQTDPVSDGTYKITHIGQDPWLVRKFVGTVKFKRPDAAKLTVTPLDFNGYPTKATGHADQIALEPNTLYYLITR